MYSSIVPLINACHFQSLVDGAGVELAIGFRLKFAGGRQKIVRIECEMPEFCPKSVRVFEDDAA